LTSAADPLRIGPLELWAPSGCQLLSANGERAGDVEAWIRSSPDHTLYHLRPHTRFVAEQGVSADVVAVAKSGEILFAFPVYVESARAFNGGFCGLLLPNTNKERTLRRTGAAIAELFAVNKHLRRFSAMQSLQCRGARDAARRSTLEWQLAALGADFTTRDVFSRVLTLTPKSMLPRTSAGATLPHDELDGELLAAYEGDLRNQIRQAQRNGLRVQYSIASGSVSEEHMALYAEYARLHGESWTRTGLHARPVEHWRTLCETVVATGATDVLVVVFDGESAVAGVSCHVYEEQAIYWSGGSLVEGQKKRANPFALHAAIGLCRRLGVRWFEIGRFEPHENDKRQAIDRYKAQFGGQVVRVPNVTLERRDFATVAADEAWRLRYQMPARHPRLWRWVQPMATHPLTRRLLSGG
jgi:hypothetical protein